jgi:hypothetical protein
MCSHFVNLINYNKTNKTLHPNYPCPFFRANLPKAIYVLVLYNFGANISCISNRTFEGFLPEHQPYFQPDMTQLYLGAKGAPWEFSTWNSASGTAP